MDLASMVTVVISALGIIVALWAVWAQTRQNNRALGVTILRDLEKEFLWSEETRSKRLALAKSLRDRKPGDPPPPEVDYILDFFDSMGLYHNKGVIDTEMAWVMFYYWLGYYWQFLKEDANDLENQQGGIVYYKNIRLFYERLTRFGRKHRKLPRDETHFAPDRLRAFLEDEIENCSLRRSTLQTQEPFVRSDTFSPQLTLTFGRKQIWIGVKNVTENKMPPDQSVK